jgi:hypothetical protein
MGTTLFMGIAAVFYLLPSFVAAARKHPSQNSIAIINIFLGWTFLGWVVALAWAASGIKESR